MSTGSFGCYLFPRFAGQHGSRTEYGCQEGCRGRHAVEGLSGAAM